MLRRISLTYDRGTLLLSGRVSREMLNAVSGLTWTWDERVGAWRAEALHFGALARWLNATFEGLWTDEVSAFDDVAFGDGEAVALRPNQLAAVEAWRKAGGRGVVVMPTGTGKTEVAFEIMRRLGRSTLIVAPVRELMYQWHRRLQKSLGMDAGLLGDGLRDVRPVTVTTYDSAAIHMAELGARFALIVYDEAHHLPGDFRRESALKSIAPYRLGLTATPERVDGRHVDLDVLIGPNVFTEHLAAVRGTILKDYDVFRVPIALEADEQRRYDEAAAVVAEVLAERRRRGQSYEWEDVLADVGRDPDARRAQRAFYAKQAIEARAAGKLRVLEDLFRLHVTDRVLVFTGSNSMAVDISRRFLVPTLLATTPKDERHEALDRFERGDAKVLVANRVLDEGVDVPTARVAIVLGGLGSTRQAKQRLGRILRRDGAARAVLYEVVAEDTREVERSRRRRRSDAYEGTLHRRL